MKVKMKHQISGTLDGKPWPAPGGEIVLSDDDGAQLCAQGMATPVAEPESKRSEKRPAKKSAQKRG